MALNTLNPLPFACGRRKLASSFYSVLQLGSPELHMNMLRALAADTPEARVSRSFRRVATSLGRCIGLHRQLCRAKEVVRGLQLCSTAFSHARSFRGFTRGMAAGSMGGPRLIIFIRSGPTVDEEPRPAKQEPWRKEAAATQPAMESAKQDNGTHWRMRRIRLHHAE